MVQFRFNAKDTPPDTAFEPVPEGWYKAVITESTLEPTSNGDGKYLKFLFKIKDKSQYDRQVFCNLNIEHPNPVAADIGKKQLSALCHAVNQMQLTNTQQLHGKPVMIKIIVQPAVKNQDGTIKYDAKNAVKGFKKVEASAPAQKFAQPPKPETAPSSVQPPPPPPPPASVPEIQHDPASATGVPKTPAWARTQ